jgi:hypothetical protein
MRNDRRLSRLHRFGDGVVARRSVRYFGCDWSVANANSSSRAAASPSSRLRSANDSFGAWKARQRARSHASAEFGIATTAELHGHDLFHGKGEFAPMKTFPRARIALYASALRTLVDADCWVILRGVSTPGLLRRCRLSVDEAHESCNGQACAGPPDFVPGCAPDIRPGDDGLAGGRIACNPGPSLTLSAGMSPRACDRVGWRYCSGSWSYGVSQMRAPSA